MITEIKRWQFPLRMTLLLLFFLDRDGFYNQFFEINKNNVQFY
jgi:hypothetical protein